MKSRLSPIRDWNQRTKAARYRANRLARQCGVSTRELERFFLRKMGQTPHAWLVRRRQLDALALLNDGATVKSAALELGYRYPSHFSRDFKQVHGKQPSSFLNGSTTPSPNGASRTHSA